MSVSRSTDTDQVFAEADQLFDQLEILAIGIDERDSRRLVMKDKRTGHEFSSGPTTMTPLRLVLALGGRACSFVDGGRSKSHQIGRLREAIRWQRYRFIAEGSAR